MGDDSKRNLSDHTFGKYQKLTEDELPHTPKKSQASTILGVISIILALIALIITSDKTNHYGEGLLLIFLIALPLMFSSLIISIVGLFLSSKKLIGRKLSTIGLILTFTPIAVAFAPTSISGVEEWIQDKRYNTFVDGVKFNKEMTVLIDYPWNKKETNYTIPDSVTSIGNSAFNGCTNLTSITIPDSVTNIGEWTFRGCTNLTNITIPDNVTSIETGTFRGCESLTSITIPDSVTTIEKWVFDDCTSLTNVTIPDGVTSIGTVAFQKCYRLIDVIFLGDAPKEGRNVFKYSAPTIYRKSEAKGWGKTWGDRPVKLISEKP